MLVLLLLDMPWSGPTTAAKMSQLCITGDESVQRKE